MPGRAILSRPKSERPTVFDDPVFAEPWQAEAFAMTVALHDKGLFSWSEWADALSAEVKKPDAASDGHDYYEHWLAALEKLLSSKGIAGKGEVDELAAAWARAAHATPHGKPILLENDPGPSR
ncbi:nitrile hydratase accessory protein [Mesorhizobium sp. WSM4884]|uniref:nitrile hydratase accessory protein n=1 Tax=Mesorhizobium sp. WSM4884 TaxID=3038542 RepID=UPI0024169E2F|nr:nitrile hydratase accessory protein [Mesorhizobium sp. WSM4884]MDG4879997.1 nitrile hydratase accessory protein [Mesorhizobium sp. WSM4884]